MLWCFDDYFIDSNVFMRESKSVGVSSDNQNYFYKEAISSRGRSDDPNDFFKALDSTFASKPYIGFFARAWNSIKGSDSRGKDIGEGLASNKIKDNESPPNQNKNNMFDGHEEPRKNDD